MMIFNDKNEKECEKMEAIVLKEIAIAQHQLEGPPSSITDPEICEMSDEAKEKVKQISTSNYISHDHSNHDENQD